MIVEESSCNHRLIHGNTVFVDTHAGSTRGEDDARKVDWDYDQALDIARTSQHMAFGGSVTIRRIAESP